jgi:hypothetical protein
MTEPMKGVKSQEFWDEMETMHIGRSFVPHHTIEDECICPQQPCGLIKRDEIDPACPEHALTAAKTFRSNHMHKECPGAPKVIPKRKKKTT